MSKPKPSTYKTRNWPAYNEALRRRGSLTIWLDHEITWAQLMAWMPPGGGIHAIN